MTRRFQLRLTVDVTIDNPQLSRLNAPDRASFVRNKVQALLENGTIRDAFDAADLDLNGAVALECREERS